VDVDVDVDADVVAVVFLDALAVRTKESPPSVCREAGWKVTLSSSASRPRGESGGEESGAAIQARPPHPLENPHE
jgi:hypothetical protein